MKSRKIAVCEFDLFPYQCDILDEIQDCYTETTDIVNETYKLAELIKNEGVDKVYYHLVDRWKEKLQGLVDFEELLSKEEQDNAIIAWKNMKKFYRDL